MSLIILRMQLAGFKREKGMILFYCLSIIIVGIIVPIFIKGVQSTFTISTLLTTTFLKPILSDSIAGEREHCTLETLLSTPINGKSIIWGKFQFCLLFSICFFGLTSICSVLMNWFIGYPISLTIWQSMGILIITVLNFSAISISGVLISASSADMRTANNSVSRYAYLLSLFLFIYISVIMIPNLPHVPAISLFFILIYLCIFLFYVIKIIRMKQSYYFENIKFKKTNKNTINYSMSTPLSQFETVFRFELKYLFTLKTTLLNFGLLSVAPSLIVYLLFYYFGNFDLNYAVFITVLVIPRVPTNLIAFSIGGEKVYKTGESLLSTPLHIRSIFLAKCMIPILVSTVMLMVSSSLTLICATFLKWINPNVLIIHKYSLEQFVLLFPLGIMISMLMIFLSAIFSVMFKTPRQGLYVSSIISYLFIIPVLVIVYLTKNILLWSLLYVGILFICNVICITCISDKINRTHIMGRL